MKKTAAIAKWEFTGRVKKASFLIYLFLMPIILSLMVELMSGGVSGGFNMPVAMGVLDKSDNLFPALKAELEEIDIKTGQPAFVLFNLENNSVKQADSLIRNNIISAYLLIDKDQKGDYYSQLRSDLVLPTEKINKLENDLYRIMLLRNAEGLKNPEFMTEDFSLKNKIIGEEGVYYSTEEYFNHTLKGFVLLILLVMVIVYGGNSLARGLIEEKSNRIIEILLSSVNSRKLLSGKIIGLSAVGIFQMVVWVTISTVMIGKTIFLDLPVTQLIIMLYYFLLGYIFYNSLFIGFGAFAGSEQEAQQITGGLTVFIILPIFASVNIINDPESLFSAILTYFPLTTSPAMMLRVTISPPTLTEVALTTLIMVMSIYAVMYVASGLFSISVLGGASKLKPADIGRIIFRKRKG